MKNASPISTNDVLSERHFTYNAKNKHPFHKGFVLLFVILMMAKIRFMHPRGGLSVRTFTQFPLPALPVLFSRLYNI